MNARAVDMCRGEGDLCVLDPPTWEDWYLSGRAGAVSVDEALRQFVVANQTFHTALGFRLGDEALNEAYGLTGSVPAQMRRLIAASGLLASPAGRSHVVDACAYGHTDHLHANFTTIGVCRETIRLDTCSERPAPFVCVCVSAASRDKARDPLSEDERFNLVAAAFLCIAVAGFMLLVRSISYTRYLLRRHCCRESDALRRVRQQDEDEETRSRTRRHGRWTRRRREAAELRQALGKKALGTPEAEIPQLWSCTLCCTFWVAVILGPLLLLYAWPCLIPGVGCDFDYYAGCGFRLPYVDEGDTSGRLTTVLAGR